MGGEAVKRRWAAAVIRHAAKKLAKESTGPAPLVDILAGGSYDEAAERAIRYLCEERSPIASDDRALAQVAGVGEYLESLPAKSRQALAVSLIEMLRPYASALAEEVVTSRFTPHRRAANS